MATRIPYAEASAAQRQLTTAYLQERLRGHFPGLRSATWPAALALFQPDLWLAGGTVTLDRPDLTQLTQYLARAPELPQLDPPVYGEPALVLAQQHLQLAELGVWVLPEVEAIPGGCGPRLHQLLSRLTQSNGLADRVMQATGWGLAVERPLPPGLPGGSPAPGGADVQQRLRALGRTGGEGNR